MANLRYQNKPYYAYCGRIKVITSNYSDLKNLLVQYPYSQVQKFNTYEECQAQLDKWTEKPDIPINYIGEKTERQRVVIEFIISDNLNCVNITLPPSTSINIPESFKHFKLLNNVYVIEFTDIQLGFQEEAFKLTQMALYVLDIIGDIIDIELYHPSMTFYHIVKHYSGDFFLYKQLKERLINRNVVYTIKR